MMCFVCEKEIEKDLKYGITPVLTLNITSIEIPKSTTALLHFHFKCFEGSAGKVYKNSIDEEILKLVEEAKKSNVLP